MYIFLASPSFLPTSVSLSPYIIQSPSNRRRREVKTVKAATNQCTLPTGTSFYSLTYFCRWGWETRILIWLAVNMQTEPGTHGARGKRHGITMNLEVIVNEPEMTKDVCQSVLDIYVGVFSCALPPFTRQSWSETLNTDEEINIPTAVGPTHVFNCLQLCLC